jgi:EAL domain-containing protein (putative c-di-GMP-specific phosphodiesterase class I)
MLEEARYIADRLISELSEFRFVWDNHLFEIGASIGMVEVSSDTKDINELMAQADVACYAAKDQGRNRANVYHADDAELIRRHTEMLRAAGIREALKQHRFCLYAQSIKPLKKASPGEPSRYEILLRLYDENGGLLTPGAFIPAAERYGLMGNVDRWVIQTTFENFAQLFEQPEDTLVSINLSGNSLNDRGLLNFVRQQISGSPASPEQICFEITETAFISNLTQASLFISEMKKLGCRFALDDFGSGLSSFAYLKNFPVDYLKIDGSFIRDIVSDPADYAMVAAINQVGHALGIETIAEFVDSEAIITILRELGVDYIQGYAVDTPAPLPRYNLPVSR